jgi:hypothetical protein
MALASGGVTRSERVSAVAEAGSPSGRRTCTGGRITGIDEVDEPDEAGRGLVCCSPVTDVAASGTGGAGGSGAGPAANGASTGAASPGKSLTGPANGLLIGKGSDETGGAGETGASGEIGGAGDGLGTGGPATGGDPSSGGGPTTGGGPAAGGTGA